MTSRPALPEMLDRADYLSGMSIMAQRHIVDTAFKIHSHDYFEIELVTAGTGIHMLNGAAHPLCTGSICFLTPEDVHAVIPDARLELYNISFSEEPVSDKLSFEALSVCCGRQIQLNRSQFEKMLPFANLLCEESRKRGELFSLAYTQSLLQCMLILLLRWGADTAPKSGGQSLGGVLFYIQRRFREPVKLDDAACYAHLSSNYFCESFRRATGLGFSEYLSNMRTRYAARLLITTDASITEICYQSGFRCFSAFSRAFMRRYGVTPSRYRKEHIN